MTSVLICLLLATAAIPFDARAAEVDAGEVQPVAGIVQAAEDYLGRRIARAGGALSARAGTLDPRLTLPRCGEPLEGYLPSGGRIDSRTVVGVRCSGPRPWKVYVPVDVIERRTVLVARRSLPRGHVLAADDLLVEERDVSRLAGGYLTDPGRALGRLLERPLPAGSVLAPASLKEQVVIERGQSVTLLVRNEGFSIRMAGVAMTDGVLNERIRVKNAASDRVVEGLIRSPQHVEVLGQQALTQ